MEPHSDRAHRAELGAGGTGVVYEAFDRERNALVALKTLIAFTPEALARFKNEFRSLQDLEHPNLVRLDELMEADSTWFFTMELIEGVDFLAHVTRRAVARPEECADTMDLADAQGARFEPARARNSVFRRYSPCASSACTVFSATGMSRSRSNAS